MIDHMAGTRTVTTEADPLSVPQRLGAAWRPVTPEGMPPVFTGGWVGYCGYDTVRYTYASAPQLLCSLPQAQVRSKRASAQLCPVMPEGMPPVFMGGWVVLRLRHRALHLRQYAPGPSGCG